MLCRHLNITLPKIPHHYLFLGGRVGDRPRYKFAGVHDAKTRPYKKKTALSACLVRCDCGEERVIDNRRLRNGSTKSCGPCGATERLPDSDWRAIWSQVRGRANHAKREMTLTPFHVEKLGLLPCAYCSRPPQNRFHRITIVGNRRLKDEEPTFLYSGIDRVDSAKGYVPGNVVPCCKFCNYAKMNRTLDEFLEQISWFGSTLTADAIIGLANELML